MYLISICNAILHVYLSYLLYVIIMYIIYVCNAVLYYLYYMPAPYSVTALHDDYCIQPICIICPHPIQSRRCIMIIVLQPQPVSARRNLPMEHPPLEACDCHRIACTHTRAHARTTCSVPPAHCPRVCISERCLSLTPAGWRCRRGPLRREQRMMNELRC